MNWKICSLALALFLSSPLLAKEDPLEEHVFPPEWVMKHQRTIGLSEAQRNILKKEIQQAQAKFTELEWDLQNEMAVLVSLMSEESVEEPRAVATLNNILKLESAIKQTHLILAIRIKNALTQDQQAKLRELRVKMREEQLKRDQELLGMWE